MKFVRGKCWVVLHQEKNNAGNRHRLGDKCLESRKRSVGAGNSTLSMSQQRAAKRAKRAKDILGSVKHIVTI